MYATCGAASRRVALLLTLVLALSAAAKDKKTIASPPSLPERLEKILADPEVSRGFWGIEVISLKKNQLLYSLNGEKLFTPASNTKLFTTAAVLALIGSDYKFRTTIETNGQVDRHGRLSGDLYVVGRGDPNLSGRTLPYNLRTERKQPPMWVLEQLADQLVQKGVKYVDGDVVGDDSYFAFERYGEGWAQDDMVWEWGAPVSALTLNDNVVFVSILPADLPGDKAFVTINPASNYYRVDNRIITTPASTGPRRVYITREPGANLLTLWGNIPADDPGANEALAIEDPADFTAQVFREMLERRGIVVLGRSRTRHTELASLSTFTVTTTAPAGGGEDVRRAPQAAANVVLANYDSQPVLQDLRVINKVSQNLHAELMLRLLGKEKGTAGTIEAGLEVMRGFLAQGDIRSEEYVFFDGSGLSRQNLVTPHAVVKLLRYADMQPWGGKFEDTLPVAGVDGSLADRFRGTNAQGRVQAKTGSLGHVNSLAGYLTTLSGDRLAFSIMSNNHNLPNKRALETIDELVEVMVDDRPKKPK
ncbi:MAG TPA: D-alanyl-D-alanine carboxypeptidase/D-alanyl-D-alanine-endopeptidase [Terriglobales bacterium]|nr:D-alanyl-D-alanine carboxypeptidase/D-alanyl-D-alanine-endopeptidase [Terriglobales bacterium]